jgi:hypothetical protein
MSTDVKERGSDIGLAVDTGRAVLARTPSELVWIVGLAAVFFSGIYFVSDVIEFAQGGFSTGQLLLTYVGEAAIPLFVIGLYAVQRPEIGRLGLAGAVGYAYTYTFFTGSVVFALAEHTRNWDALVHRMGPLISIHGVLMVLAGLAFGWAVVRARVLPRWTGVMLMAGVVLAAGSSGLPEVVQMVAAGVRAVAFAAMGISALFARRAGLPSRRPGQLMRW